MGEKKQSWVTVFDFIYFVILFLILMSVCACEIREQNNRLDRIEQQLGITHQEPRDE